MFIVVPRRGLISCSRKSIGHSYYSKIQLSSKRQSKVSEKTNAQILKDRKRHTDGHTDGRTRVITKDPFSGKPEVQNNSILQRQ